MRAIETERCTTGGKISLTAYSITRLTNLGISLLEILKSFSKLSIVE